MATAKKTKAKPGKSKAKPTAKKSAAKKSKAMKPSASQGSAELDAGVELSGLIPAAEPSPPIPTEAWNGLAAGHIVLAYDKKAKGWFDAKIEAITDGGLVLRWHDYADNTAKFTRKLEQVGLKHPMMMKPL